MERCKRDNGLRFFLIGMLFIAALSAGCAGRQRTVDLHPSQQVTEEAGASADATSYGHPFRLVAFVLHPIGVAIDYVIVRPIYYIASLAPTVFGYTPEDDAAFRKERKTY